MTPQEVEGRLDQFLELVDKQQAIKEQLLRMKMWGHKATADEAEARLGKHQELIAQLEAVRHQEMLPILEELAQFVAAARQAQAAQPESAAPPGEADSPA